MLSILKSMYQIQIFVYMTCVLFLCINTFFLHEFFSGIYTYIFFFLYEAHKNCEEHKCMQGRIYVKVLIYTCFRLQSWTYLCIRRKLIWISCKDIQIGEKGLYWSLCYSIFKLTGKTILIFPTTSYSKECFIEVDSEVSFDLFSLIGKNFVKC